MDIVNSYGMIFNHEGSTHSHLFNEGRNDDQFYIRNNFKKFRERYARRIQNFRNYINSSQEIVLIFNKYPGDKHQDHELLKLFSNAFPRKKFILNKI